MTLIVKTPEGIEFESGLDTNDLRVNCINPVCAIVIDIFTYKDPSRVRRLRAQQSVVRTNAAVRNLLFGD